MNTRICKICQVSKELNEENFCRSCGDYLSRTCRKCQEIHGKHYKTKYRIRPRVMTTRAWLLQCLNSTRHCSKSRQERHYKLKENDLTIEFLLDLWTKQLGKCYVTGLKTEYCNVCSASIDRIESSKGYLQNNIVLTCQWVNTGRNRCPIPEFKEILLTLPKTISG
jgi:hypothetical protein